MNYEIMKRRIIEPMDPMTKETNHTVNAQVYCEALINKFYMSSAAIMPSKGEKIQDMFIEQNCDDFNDLIFANHDYRCFVPEIEKILDAAWMLLDQYPNGIDDKGAEMLTDLQSELGTYLIEHF